MTQLRELRPMPRRVVALATVTAILATFLARTERLHAPVAPVIAGAADAIVTAPVLPHARGLSADLPASGQLTATLYDPSGARVRVLVDGETRAQGAVYLAWDGRDETGRLAPAGAYALKLEVRGERVRALRMTRVHWPASAPRA
jgi:hypothetical protein